MSLNSAYAEIDAASSVVDSQMFSHVYLLTRAHEVQRWHRPSYCNSMFTVDMSCGCYRVLDKARRVLQERRILLL